MSVTSLTRRQVRYWLFRKANEANGGASSEGVPLQIEAFKDMPVFAFCGGWKDFGSKWDISQSEPWEIIPLEKSLLAQWNEECEKKAKKLVPKEETIIRAEKKPVGDDVVYDINVSKDGTSTTRKWNRKRKNR